MIGKLSIPPMFYQHADVIHVVLTLFEITFLKAFELEIINMLKNAQQLDKALFFSNVTMFTEPYKQTTQIINDKLYKTLDVIGAYFFNKTVDLEQFKSQITDIQQHCHKLIAWIRFIKTIGAVYEIRFEDKLLEGDIHIIFWNNHFMLPFIHLLTNLGYRHQSRINKYIIDLTYKQQRQQIVPIFKSRPY